MELVIVESPFAATEEHTQEEHIIYAKRCMLDCLKRGEAPFASHLLYTQQGILDDSIPEEREWGITAGFAFRKAIHKSVVYIDYGISKGMNFGIANAREHGNEIVYREIGKNPPE